MTDAESFSPQLFITPGEPAGIGPELLVQLAQQPREVAWTAVADPQLLEARAAQLKLPLQVCTASPQEPVTTSAGSLTVLPVSLTGSVTAGVLDPANASYVLNTLEQATDACLQQPNAALVTGPVQKSVINDAGVPFSGHTEFLCERAGVEDVVMLLVAGSLRVALATTHLPLRDVSDAISRALLLRRLGILQRDLRDRFGIVSPKILVAGLNPHAGEGGHLGQEEIETITPVCEELRAQGWDLIGPLPADTLFTPQHLELADAVFAMYHDQGLPVLKNVGFGRAVNVTLGLPFVRTSVDHGTALDLAGTGQADPGSFAQALLLAEQLLMRDQATATPSATASTTRLER